MGTFSRVAYNPGMPEPPEATRRITPLKMPSEASSPAERAASDDKVLCERCGADMYRMHAVWRCSACNFKTDCCGW